MISYDEGNLWCHLVECLKLKKFTPFPEYKNNKRVKWARAVTINRDVYCICAEHILKRALTIVQINLWRRVVCVMNGTTRNVWKFQWTYFAVTVLQNCGDVNLANRFELLTIHTKEAIISNLLYYLHFCKNIKTDSHISLSVSFISLPYLFIEWGSQSLIFEKNLLDFMKLV